MDKKFSKLKSLIFTLAFCLLFISCGKNDEANTDAATMSPVTDLATIEQASDRGTLVGRSVALDGLRVDRVVGTYVFWGGTTNGIPIFRKDRLEGRSSEPVRSNEKVRVDGVVRLVSSVPVTDPLWDHVNENEKADILAARVFISAEKVQIIH